MNLHRDILEELVEWKNSKTKLPLILRGARQIGKTWCMLELGKNYYEKTAYFNFDKEIDLKKEFQTTKDPKRLIDILSLYAGFQIQPKTTLIIFDEIQECNEALNSLKYFAEDTSIQYDIICAGSLLGVALAKEGSFPVGKVRIIDMFPLTFKEFLYVADIFSYNYISSLTDLETPLPGIIFSRVKEIYRKYLICGGIPRAVLAMVEKNDLNEVDEILNDLLISYSLDFKKHASASMVPKIIDIWKSIPSQLAKENKKFIYCAVKSGARAREYEAALQWLLLAGLIYKIYDCNNPLLPLTAYDNLSSFKIYLFDIGLLRVMAQLPASIFTSDKGLLREFKGALAENAILQNLIPQFKVTPRYWTSAGKAEIDFLIQYEEQIIPVEVKSSENISSKSMKVFIDKYQPQTAILFSTQNLKSSKNFLCLPQFLSPWLSSFL